MKSLTDHLQTHLGICHDLLAVVEREHQALVAEDSKSPFEFYQARKHLFPQLADSVQSLKLHRAEWQKLSQEQRAEHANVPVLLRENQDLIMKILVLDRENEQALLRRGLVPPKHLPSVNRQRPHYVADLYRRGSGAT
jgi:flagellar biosynthesis/type III secretory pathway chaperone